MFLLIGVVLLISACTEYNDEGEELLASRQTVLGLRLAQ
jgi:hypothetical protein